MKSNANELQLLETIEAERRAENERHEAELNKIQARYLAQRDYFRQELAPKTEAQIQAQRDDILRRLGGITRTTDGIKNGFIASSLQNCLPAELDMRLYQLKHCDKCDGENPICSKVRYFFVNVGGRYVTIAQRPCRKRAKPGKKSLTLGLKL